MALSPYTTWEARSTGASTNGGAFNTTNANFATDLTATSGNTSSPIVSSASYNFVAGDVGAFVFIKSGTNWLPGWYQIASVASNAATLTASIGSANLFAGASVLNTAAGVASVASPTAGTWGVDYSQQAAAQFAFTDLVIDGTTNTKFTSAAKPVGKNFIGNIMQVTGGTGFTTGYFEIVSTVTTTATCDRSLGTLSSTGGTANLGGAVDGLITLTAAMATNNWAFIQASGGYTQTATPTFAQSGTPANNGPYNRLIGYTTYRGDNGRATITLSTNTGLVAIKITGAGWKIENFSINCASLGTSTGINCTQPYLECRNLKIANFTTGGIIITGQNTTTDFCEITGGGSGGTAGIQAAGVKAIVSDNWVHDNQCPGILTTDSVTVYENLVTNNTGASSDGINTQYGCTVINNTCYANGRHGIFQSSNVAASIVTRNNIVSQNGGFGIKFAGAAIPAAAFFDGNAYYLNTSGTRSNGDDEGTSLVVNGVVPYFNTKDITLSADPFVAKASDDYRLNNTAGGGAACRGFGVPTTWPGNSLTVAAADMGAVQHVDSGGGGTTYIFQTES